MRWLTPGDIVRGLENFASPSAAGMLDSLGRTRRERVDNMAAMLRNSDQADIDELGMIFGLAMAKLAEEQATAGWRDGTDPVKDRPRRRRGHTAAEWRRERRLAS